MLPAASAGPFVPCRRQIVPTYQYACTECGHQFEIVQAFSDDALTHCPQCEGRLRKVFNAVGVVFKGSGFYRTDSRAGSGAGGSTSGSSSSAPAAGKDSPGSGSTSGGSAAGSSTSGSPSGSGSAKGGSSSASAGSTSSGSADSS